MKDKEHNIEIESSVTEEKEFKEQKVNLKIKYLFSEVCCIHDRVIEYCREGSENKKFLKL